MRHLTRSLIIVGMLTSCATTPIATKQYLLRSDKLQQYTVTNNTTITGIGSIIIATYIDNLGLVLETANGEVRTAQSHQWAEPLRESIRTFLAQEISSKTGAVIRTRPNGNQQWQQQIDIRIDQLHGTATGQAKLVAYWSIIGDGEQQAISENKFTGTEPLTEDGYGSLVNAHINLLQQLSAEIAKTLSSS